ncbi:MAG: phosphoenolpyruvate carboxykinase (ATP) [Nitrospirae bacterium]|nr:phosphoenolpyruvate carboxykinase (ATP) [Nitrospirota bacterium]
MGIKRSTYGIENHGIDAGNEYWNLPVEALFEEAISRKEGNLAKNGPLIVRTGLHTGRAVNDKFIVREPTTEDSVWWGKENRGISQENFDRIYNRMMSFIKGKDVFVQDCWAGHDKQYRMPIRVISIRAWHSRFARALFIPVARGQEQIDHVPDFTVIDVPGFLADQNEEGTNSETFIIVNFARKMVLIGGTSYAGEIKKSIFSIMNFILPERDVLPMHCSANMNDDGDVCIFFGLSGTGKTTLSADTSRKLIGDDEHGWSDRGVFNFENGCYAKVIRLSAEAEPQIYSCTRKFGVILENVGFDSQTRELDLNDDSLTENTRAAYPLIYIDNAVPDGQGGHPKNIVMLTCDAFGVMPPVARLTEEQAMYHFVSGYTAKVAGTEKGVGKEPKATFSTCFGAPFMSRHPSVYARLLGDRIARHKVDCWLVNTGWIGGAFGTGRRISIAHTRAIISAILEGGLRGAETRTDQFFGLHVPLSCEGVPSEIMNPRDSWPDKVAYDLKARELAELFRENFKRFEADVDARVRAGAPPV